MAGTGASLSGMGHLVNVSRLRWVGDSGRLQGECPKFTHAIGADVDMLPEGADFPCSGCGEELTIEPTPEHQWPAPPKRRDKAPYK